MFLSEQIKKISFLVLVLSLGPYMMLELNPEEGSLNEKTEQKKTSTKLKAFFAALS